MAEAVPLCTSDAQGAREAGSHNLDRDIAELNERKLRLVAAAEYEEAALVKEEIQALKSLQESNAPSATASLTDATELDTKDDTPLCAAPSLEIPQSPLSLDGLVSSFSWEPVGIDEAVIELASQEGNKMVLPASRGTVFVAERCSHSEMLKVSSTDPSIPQFTALPYKSGGLNSLAWLLRQYHTVEPPDRNHDTSQHSPNCCCLGVEATGEALHSCCELSGAVLACVCTCGCYPWLDEDLVLEQRASHHDTQHEPISKCTQIIKQIDTGSSTILAVAAFPTKCCGLWCGHNVRVQCPVVREQYGGPDRPGRLAACLRESVGGAGSFHTHCTKGCFMCLTQLRRRVVNGCCNGIANLEELTESHCADDEKRIATHALGSTACQLVYCVTLGCIDTLLCSWSLGCCEDCVNGEVYLQGPVILQGFLTVNSTWMSLEKCWCVLRPWSLALYESKQQMRMDIAPTTLIPNRTMVDVSPYEEGESLIEVSTSDFRRFQLEPASIEMYRDNNLMPIGIEVWRAALRGACDRYETLRSYDQGCSEFLNDLKRDSNRCSQDQLIQAPHQPPGQSSM